MTSAAVSAAQLSRALGLYPPTSEQAAVIESQVIVVGRNSDW